MAQYRKKPVVIEATQWFKMGDHPAVVTPPKFPSVDEAMLNTCGWIKTLEGGHIVTPGDWIITGVQGEHYPCKPDIFEMTYEAALNFVDFPLIGGKSMLRFKYRDGRFICEMSPVEATSISSSITQACRDAGLTNE